MVVILLFLLFMKLDCILQVHIGDRVYRHQNKIAFNQFFGVDFSQNISQTKIKKKGEYLLQAFEKTSLILRDPLYFWKCYSSSFL